MKSSHGEGGSCGGGSCGGGSRGGRGRGGRGRSGKGCCLPLFNSCSGLVTPRYVPSSLGVGL